VVPGAAFESALLPLEELNAQLMQVRVVGVCGMRWLRFGLLGLAALALAGCSTFFTGGGFIRSVNHTDKATFGFVVQCNNPENPEECAPAKINGTYYDHGVGVRLKFDGGVIAGPAGCVADPNDCANLPPGTDPDQCMFGEVHYISQDPKNRGEGDLQLFACDLGEPGKLNGDFLVINVLSGPYDGYENGGTIQGGNLQAH
jgi:hypothetical protein